jgi:hypothetical protein
MINGREGIWGDAEDLLDVMAETGAIAVYVRREER